MEKSTEELLNYFTQVPNLNELQVTPALVEAALSDPDCSSVGNVLVLYTGGTIGMRSHGGVYEPEANFLVNKVKQMSMFQDLTFAKRNQIHVDYFSSKSHGNSTKSSQISSSFSSWPIICMPPTIENRRIFFTIAEYSELLDSSNCTMDNWVVVAQHIKLFYEKFDGFIVLHGTDTLAYASSTLSFILEGLQKPVVVTGSQIPIGELRSDGRENLLGSLMIAGGGYQIPEVTVFFHNRLFRGNRVVKCSATDLDAFTSPNYPPLAEMNVDVDVHLSKILQSVGDFNGLKVTTSLSKNVVMLRIFPSITTETVKAIFKPPVEGVILQTYGAGNVPATRPDILNIFKEASEQHGIIILNTTQCWRGSVQAIYATGAVLNKFGVIPGYDITPEAALAKVAYVLGKWKDVATRRQIMTQNMRGEMTYPKLPSTIYADNFSLHNIVSGQAGIGQLVGHVGQLMAAASNNSQACVWAHRLLPLLLCSAAAANDLDTLQQLFDITNNFEFFDHEHRTPLHIAAGNSNESACLFMLKNGANPNPVDRFGYTPMTYAVRCKTTNASFISRLHEIGATLSPIETTRARETNISAMHGQIEQLKLFKLAGSNLEELDMEGRATLHVAVAYRQVETVRYLVETVANGGAGVNPNKMTGYGTTALTEAEIRHLQDIINILKPISGA